VKATIVVSNHPSDDGAVDVHIEFDPPLTEDTPENAVATIVEAFLNAVSECTEEVVDCDAVGSDVERWRTGGGSN
jgi:hypothetical protein